MSFLKKTTEKKPCDLFAFFKKLICFSNQNIRKKKMNNKKGQDAESRKYAQKPNNFCVANSDSPKRKHKIQKDREKVD